MTTTLDRPTPADPVRRIMARDPAAVRPEDSLLAVARDLAAVGRLMRDAGVRHVPIVGEHDEVVGVVSMRDVLAVLLPADEPSQR